MNKNKDEEKNEELENKEELVEFDEEEYREEEDEEGEEIEEEEAESKEKEENKKLEKENKEEEIEEEEENDVKIEKNEKNDIEKKEEINNEKIEEKDKVINSENINNLENNKNIIKNESELISSINNKNNEVHEINNYYGKKGIIKRTIGIGKVNVKVCDNDDALENNEEKYVSIINNNYLSSINKDPNELSNIVITSNYGSLSNSKNIPYNINFPSIFHIISDSGQTKILEIKNNSISKEIVELSKQNNNMNNNINKNKILEIQDNSISNSISNDLEELNKTNSNNKNKEVKNKHNHNISKKNKPIIYNIDNRKFKIKVIWSFSNVNKNEKLINVNLSTIYPGSQIIHWAVYTSKSPTKWCLPPKSYYPQLTKRVDNALETEFYSTSENKERIISIKLPIKLNNKNDIDGIYFAVYDPIKNLWYNNFGNNFQIKFNS